MVGIPGPRLESLARELVAELQVGGIILFARNLESPEQVWELNRDLQRLALEATGRPLLIALDQEGGPVQRLKAPFTLIPPARELGLTRTPAEIEGLANQVARELCMVGVNLNLAPVLDVARGPDCPLWERSFGQEAEPVARLGVAAIRGFLAGGVLPVAKHFPGLGDTRRDSHAELPTALSDDPGRAIDLLPFRRAVAAGVPVVMTAHLKVPSWDDPPATLSATAIQHWLRQELGFGGVVMTDDLEMGAIARETRVPQAACQALAAGADLLLICQDWQAAWEAARLLQEQGLTARAQEAVARLDQLKQRICPPGASSQEIRQFLSGKNSERQGT